MSVVNSFPHCGQVRWTGMRRRFCSRQVGEQNTRRLVRSATVKTVSQCGQRRAISDGTSVVLELELSGDTGVHPGSEGFGLGPVAAEPVGGSVDPGDRGPVLDVTHGGLPDALTGGGTSAVAFLSTDRPYQPCVAFPQVNGVRD